jgi:hypothetical protein
VAVAADQDERGGIGELRALEHNAVTRTAPMPASACTSAITADSPRPASTEAKSDSAG